LVTWTSDDGVPLQGILYKPENFDPTKKYPMVSYFYEDLSDGLYGYIAPNGRNTINPTHYASNGYLVFEPDIHYETGHPGQSAMKSIVPGVQMLIAKGFVDPKKMGLQGQSWGGYQTAYMITQTHMFAAAMAGAPVANMTSAYGGIRWGSGVNRSMQYENGQSRIGKSLFDAQDLYLENSPLFHLPYVTTPLFLMANDKDAGKTRLNDEDLWGRARDYEWHRPKGAWRIAPSTDETPSRLVFYRGETEAYRVEFVSRGEDWVIASIEPVSRAVE